MKPNESDMRTSGSPMGGVDPHQLAKILGGVFGGLAVVCFIVLVVFCVLRRHRRSNSLFGAQRFNNESGEGEIAMDTKLATVPTILLLYSYDCELHERVIVEFATYIRHVFGCSVALDIWEQAEIQNRGVQNWLEEKLQACHFVLLICSTGARYKCARTRHFYMRQERPIPEMFSLAVDMAAERMRQEKVTGRCANVFTVAYFDYSGQSVIPPKLDTADRVCLMRDIHLLYCLWYNILPEVFEELKSGKKKKKFNNNNRVCSGMTADTYFLTDTGQQLHVAIGRLRRYFEANPDWLAPILEPVSGSRPVQPAVDADSRDQNSTHSPGKYSCERRDSDLQFGRRKHHDIDDDESESCEHTVNSDHRENAIITGQSYIPATSPSLDTQVPLSLQSFDHRPPSVQSGHINSPLISHQSWTPSNGVSAENEIPSDEDDFYSDHQLQKDIADIQNFDNHHSWYNQKETGPTYMPSLDTDNDQHLGFGNPLFNNSPVSKPRSNHSYTSDSCMVGKNDFRLEIKLPSSDDLLEHNDVTQISHHHNGFVVNESSPPLTQV